LQIGAVGGNQIGKLLSERKFDRSGRPRRDPERAH